MIKQLAAIIMSIVWCCSANSELVVEVGPNFVSGHPSKSIMVLAQYRWRDTWSLGARYISAQEIETCGRSDCMWDIKEQWLIGGEGQYTWKRLKLRFGVYYLPRVTRISSAHINFRSSVEFTITPQFAVKVAHLSHGGTGSDQTLCSEGWCWTDKQNIGMNTLLLVWRFRE